jgi:uncharacterized protein RhaS with RHS repeats
MKTIQKVVFLTIVLLAANSQAGRWLTRDPIEFMERDPWPTMNLWEDPQQINLYQFVLNNPVNRIDPLGLWSPGAHDALIDHALKNTLPKSDLDILKQSSRDFDKATQSSDESFKHSMRKKGQTVEDAIKERDKFIKDKFDECKRANDAGKRNEALRLLGEALHPIMDASSPMHTDEKGNPKEWNPWHPWGHSPNDHIGNETVSDITKSIYEQQDKAILDAYQKVFGK